MPKAATVTEIAPKAAKKTAKRAPAPADEDLTDDWFAPVDDVVDFTNTLLYGREGSGKTTGAARLANLFSQMPAGSGKVLVINAEGGLKKTPLRKRGVDTSKIVLWPDPKKHERVSFYSLDKIHRRVKADLEKDPDSWGGVIFDSSTEIYQAILDHVQKKRVQQIINRGQEADPEFVDIADYGNMSKMFKDILRKFRDLPCHFVVTALERRDLDKDTGKPNYGPAVTPGLQADLLGYVDFVLMCKAEDEDGPFRALTRANSRYRAKDRFDVLPKIMVEPWLDRIVAYVEGTLEPETDPEQERYKGKGAELNKTPQAEEEEEEEEAAGDETD
jgi:hypothetical protein